MSTGFIGKDGFSWFFGVVEDRMDPLEIGRVRVRVFGYHSSSIAELPTEKLPWATVIQPATSSNFSGKGFSSVGLLEGTWVFGFFADPNSYQIPVVIGGINGLNSSALKQLKESYGNGFKDPRNIKNLPDYPTDQVDRTYMDGAEMFVRGDTHGAQLQNIPRDEKYPTKLYQQSKNSTIGTPDTNILALNDQKRINKTIIDLKTKTREEGGILIESVPVANIIFKPFATGVIGLSRANLGTIKGLGYPPNYVISSSFSSLKTTSNQYVASPTNANSEKIHTGIEPMKSLKSFTKSIPNYKNALKVGNTMMSRLNNVMNNVTNFPGTVVGESTSVVKGAITG